MKLIVLMKQVIDPEAPVSSFKIDADAGRAIPPKGTPPVLSPFDENALEAALRLKDSREAEVTVICLGPRLARPVLRKALAAGADELICLEDEVFHDLDGYATSYILSRAIKTLGKYDLILCGRQAADSDAGQVGSGIAAMLGLPLVTLARRIEATGSRIRVERVVADGYEVIESPLPAVVTVSNELGELRSASLAAIIAAQKKESTTRTAADLGIDPSWPKRTRLKRLYIPVREATCQFIDGESPQTTAANLARKLRQDEII